MDTAPESGVDEPAAVTKAGGLLLSVAEMATADEAVLPFESVTVKATLNVAFVLKTIGATAR